MRRHAQIGYRRMDVHPIADTGFDMGGGTRRGNKRIFFLPRHD